MSITILATLLFTLPELFQNVFHVFTNTVMLQKCQISESNRPSIQVLKHLFDQCLTILPEKRFSSKPCGSNTWSTDRWKKMPHQCQGSDQNRMGWLVVGGRKVTDTQIATTYNQALQNSIYRTWRVPSGSKIITSAGIRQGKIFDRPLCVHNFNSITPILAPNSIAPHTLHPRGTQFHCAKQTAVAVSYFLFFQPKVSSAMRTPGWRCYLWRRLSSVDLQQLV